MDEFLNDMQDTKYQRIFIYLHLMNKINYCLRIKCNILPHRHICQDCAGGGQKNVQTRSLTVQHLISTKQQVHVVQE